MNKDPSSKKRLFTFVLLPVWFFVWGICPWDNASVAAQPLVATHAGHGHQEMDDTHHTSKGVEHSCVGAISLSKQQSNWGKDSLQPLPRNESSGSIFVFAQFHQPPHLPLPFSQTLRLPKRFSNLYQIHQSFRL
ncbi:MAG: hypothetical protein ABGX83_09420 [Nitrospira sp.]|nr:hypothetical protein [Candidatus Manganitrophaceae bacterium]HIL34388.1 hypothetical protein [Candidatus Manganitrophaceae bacterium]